MTQADSRVTRDVRHAIARSVSHNEIVTLEPDDDDIEVCRDELRGRCDDSADNGAVTEYWGRDAAGDEWRVHIDGRRREADDDRARARADYDAPEGS